MHLISVHIICCPTYAWQIDVFPIEGHHYLSIWGWGGGGLNEKHWYRYHQDKQTWMSPTENLQQIYPLHTQLYTQVAAMLV